MKKIGIVLLLAIVSCNTVKKTTQMHTETKDSVVVKEVIQQQHQTLDSGYKKTSDSTWDREIEITYLNDSVAYFQRQITIENGRFTSSQPIKSIKIKEKGNKSTTDTTHYVRATISQTTSRDSAAVHSEVKIVQKSKETRRFPFIFVVAVVVIVIFLIVVFLIKRYLFVKDKYGGL